MRKIKFFGIMGLLVGIFLLTACGGSNKWGAEAQPGKYTMSEKKEYPYISVVKYEYINEFGEDDTGLGISVYIDDMLHGLSNDEAEQGGDGTYYLEGSQWSYIVSFNGKGQAKIEMEETGDNGIADAISKSMYKKGVGTYKYFKESTKTLNEALEDAYNELENGMIESGMIVENTGYSSTDFVDSGRTYVSKNNGEMIFLNAWYAVSFSQDDINIEAMFTQNGELDRRSLTLNLSNTDKTPLTYYVNNSDGYLERNETLTLNEDGSLSIQYTEDGIEFSGTYYLATSEDVEMYKELLEQAAENVVSENENIDIVYGTYENHNDSYICDAEVGFYTDERDINYVYLEGVSAGGRGVTDESLILLRQKDGTYIGTGEYNGTSAVISFSDGVMNVEITYSDNEDSYNLNGAYILISELDLNSVG